MDDTFLLDGVWTGKGGPIVTYLQAKNFYIVDIFPNGVLLKKI
jgi:hypothetical protein